MSAGFAPPHPSDPSAEALRGALTSVLHEPPFTLTKEISLGERLSAWLDERLSGLHWPHAASLAAQGWLFWLLACLLAAAAGWAVWRALGRHERWRLPTPASAAVDELAEFALAPAHLVAARAALGRGDARAAVEQLWQVVAALAAGPPQTALTPRQQVRRLQPHVSLQLYEQLGQVQKAHERACYAGHAPALSEIAALIDALGVHLPEAA